MADSSDSHSSRRTAAAAAASASTMIPLNGKAKKRTDGGGNSGTKLVEAARKKVKGALGTVSTNSTGSAKISKAPTMPPPPPVPDDDGKLPILNEHQTTDADESYGNEEKALSEYLKLHPMLSLESTSFKTLQFVANLIEESSIQSKSLEIVPKSHDDMFLRRGTLLIHKPTHHHSNTIYSLAYRPANARIGERSCCLGDRCICLWLGRWRYGEQTDMAFQGVEFLLPSQYKRFQETSTLPETHGKCLLCSRYFHTFLYRCARSDPTFNPHNEIQLQAYGNVLGTAKGVSIPSHASSVCDADGYSPEAMLFVDEAWADTDAARTSMGSLLWKPCVKFCATHYEYVKDPASGTPRIVQMNVASGALDIQHFGQPARRTAATGLATQPQA